MIQPGRTPGQKPIFDKPVAVVTPAKAGVQCSYNDPILLDTGFRRYDIRGGFSTFYEGTIFGKEK